LSRRSPRWRRRRAPGARPRCLAFAYAATGMMGSIQTGLATALRVSASRPMARAKLVDLILVLGAGSLVLATVGVTLLGRVSDRISARVDEATGLQGGPVLDTLSRGLWFALAAVVVMRRQSSETPR
jgi:uncharacterized BrkB/YihY/UPF0761 family membrane protein